MNNRELDAQVAGIVGHVYVVDPVQPCTPIRFAPTTDPAALETVKAWLVGHEDVVHFSIDWAQGGSNPWHAYLNRAGIDEFIYAPTEGEALCIAVVAAFGDQP